MIDVTHLQVVSHEGSVKAVGHDDALDATKSFEVSLHLLRELAWRVEHDTAVSRATWVGERLEAEIACERPFVASATVGWWSGRTHCGPATRGLEVGQTQDVTVLDAAIAGRRASTPVTNLPPIPLAWLDETGLFSGWREPSGTE